MEKYYGIIYKATNKINSKSYIGQTTKSLNTRINQHTCCAVNGKSSAYFHKAMKTYGPENFEWKIIAICNSENELNAEEINMIKKYDTFKNGYNLDTGGAIRTAFRHTKEAKRKISEGNKGQKRTKETKRKISEALKGKPKSKTHCERVSLANKGRKRTKKTD